MLGCNCHLLFMRPDVFLWQRTIEMIMQMEIFSAAHRYDAIFMSQSLFCFFAAINESSCSRQRACLRSTIKWIIIHLQSQCAKTPRQWQWMSQTLNGMFSDSSQHWSLRHTKKSLSLLQKRVKSWCFWWHAICRHQKTVIFSYSHADFHIVMLIDILESCGLLLDYCDVFICCLESHSDGTHSLQRIQLWASDIMLSFSKSFQMKKQTHLGVRFQQTFIYWNTFFKQWVHKYV